MTPPDADRLTREIYLRATLPNMPGEVAARLAEALVTQTISAGTSMFEIGDVSDHLYFVTEGKLAMDRTDEPTWEFGPRSIVGIIDVMLDRPRMRSCRAIEDSVVLDARGSTWLDLLEDDALLARSSTMAFARQVPALWRTLGQAIPQPELTRVSLPSAPLALYERMLALRDSALLRKAGIQAVASLSQIAEEQRLEPGEVLFDVGSPGDTLYMVADGIIELSHENPDFRLLHGAGSVVAGPAVLAREFEGYSARAQTSSVVLRVRDEDFFDQAEEHFGLTRAALAYIVGEREPLLRLRPPRA